MIATATQELPPHGPGPRSVGPPAVMVLCEIPSLDRWTRPRLRTDGEIEEVTHILALKGEWRRLPESSDPAWDVRDLGPFVVACKIVG